MNQYRGLIAALAFAATGLVGFAVGWAEHTIPTDAQSALQECRDEFFGATDAIMARLGQCLRDGMDYEHRLESCHDEIHRYQAKLMDAGLL